jgi:hypothetical protein
VDGPKRTDGSAANYPKHLLVLEDGSEYTEFASVFLTAWTAHRASDLAEATLVLDSVAIEAFLVDLRFERARPETLLGDTDELAARLFAGDRGRAIRWQKDQHGVLLLAALRAAGHRAPAVFVHDFDARRMANLRALYAPLVAVPDFDAGAIDRALRGESQ